MREAEPIVNSRKFASGFLAVFLLAAGMVTVSSPSADAATPNCNTTVNIKPRAGLSYYMVIPKSSAANTVSCYMERGATGREVRALQTTLAYCYNVPESNHGPNFGPGDIDGVYGAKTAYALWSVQLMIFPQRPSAHDGIYGPNTAAAIYFPWRNPNNDYIMSTCTWRNGDTR